MAGGNLHFGSMEVASEQWNEQDDRESAPRECVPSSIQRISHRYRGDSIQGEEACVLAECRETFWKRFPKR